MVHAGSNRNRLLDIAKQISGFVAERTDVRANLAAITKKIKARELELTPFAGWQGKNADERKNAEQTVFFADEMLKTLEEDRQQSQTAIDCMGDEIEVLIEERDAIRWTIRDREQFAVTGMSVLDELKAQAADESRKIEDEYDKYLTQQEDDTRPDPVQPTVYANPSDDPNDPNYVPF
jgi:chromosome segregation ATPase